MPTNEQIIEAMRWALEVIETAYDTVGADAFDDHAADTFLGLAAEECHDPDGFHLHNFKDLLDELGKSEVDPLIAAAPDLLALLTECRECGGKGYIYDGPLDVYNCPLCGWVGGIEEEEPDEETPTQEADA